MAEANLIIKIGGQIDGFDKAMTRALGRLQSVASGMQNLGQSMSLSVSAPLAGIGVGAVALASNFQNSFAKIKANIDGVTAPALESLRKQALKLGADTAFSAQQAADGMAVFASAGFNADQIYKSLPGTLNLAAAGTMAVADAAALTKNILGQFGLEAAKSSHVADVLAQASKETSATMAEMGTTLTYVGPAARGAGQGLEETIAAIEALDAAGIKGEQAGTGLRGVIASLLAPSKDAAKILGDLQIRITDTAGKILPLSDIMEQFRVKLSGIGSEAERQRVLFEVFGREAANSAQVLANTGGAKLDEFEKKLKNSGGAAEALARTLNSGLKYQIDQLKGSLETVGIALGEALIPSAKKAAEAVTDLINRAVLPALRSFRELPDVAQNAAIGIGVFAASLGPALIGLGAVSQSLISTARLLKQLQLLDYATLLIASTRTFNLALAEGLIPTLTKTEFLLGSIGAATPWVGLIAGLGLLAEAVLRSNSALEGAARIEQQHHMLLRDLTNQYFESRGFVEAWDKSHYKAMGTILEFVQALDPVKPAASTAGAAVGAMGLLADEAAKKFDKLTAAARLALESVQRAFNDGKSSMTQVESAQRALDAAIDKSDPGRVIERNRKATEIMAAAVASANSEMMNSLSEGLRKTQDAIDFLTGEFERKLSDVRASMGSTTVVVDSMIAKFRDAAAQFAREHTIRLSPEIMNSKMDPGIGKMGKEVDASMSAASKSASRFQQQVSLVLNDVARDIADNVVHWKGLKAAGISTFEDIGKAIIRSAISYQLTQLTKTITGMIDKSSALGKVLGKVFGPGATSGLGGVNAPSVIKNAVDGASGAANVAGGVANAAGGVTSTTATLGSKIAGSAVAQITNLATGIVSAVSGVIGNVQQASANKKLDDIRGHTLIAANQLRDGIQPTLNTYLPWLPILHDRLKQLTDVGIFVRGGEIGEAAGAGAGGGATVNNYYFTANGINDPVKFIDQAFRAGKQRGYIK